MPQGDDDLMLRALVQLTEAQAQQIDVLKRVLGDLEGKLRLRGEVDVLLGHEVRTPLTVVRGVLHTLKERDVEPPEHAELVERALSHAVHLSDVVEDLIQPPDGGHGGPRLPRARMRHVRLRDLVHQGADAVADRLEPGQLHVDVDDELVVATAPSRFVAVLVNLLENSAKYGGGSPIDLSARLTRDRILVVEVADRGPGLDGATADELFAAFSRGPQAGDAPGRGVGLYLVRMLSRSLGGDAMLADRDGGGMLVGVRLPQRRGDDPVAPPRAPAEASEAVRAR